MKYKTKIIFSSIISGIWLYFKKEHYYFTLPNKNIFTAIIVGIWIYLNYIDPIALPLGLFILYINELFFVFFFNSSYNTELLIDHRLPIENRHYRNIDRNIRNVDYRNFLATSNYYRDIFENSNIFN